MSASDVSFTDTDPWKSEIAHINQNSRLDGDMILIYLFVQIFILCKYVKWNVIARLYEEFIDLKGNVTGHLCEEFIETYNWEIQT